MKTGLYDWQEIAAGLNELHSKRKAASDAACEEIARLEDAITTVNQHIGKFAFRLSEFHGDENPHATVRVSLKDLREDYEFPSYFEVNYFFEGHSESYFVLPDFNDAQNQRIVNRVTQPVGSWSAEDWFAPLGDLAKAIIRDTPRPASED